MLAQALGATHGPEPEVDRMLRLARQAFEAQHDDAGQAATRTWQADRVAPTVASKPE